MYIEYAIALSAVLTTSILGGYFTSKSVKSEWYMCIKPRQLTPPSFVFPIVWTILYFTIFLAFAHSLRQKYTIINILTISTLVLNILWCYFYFAKKQLHLALYILLILIALSVGIIVLSIKKKDYHLANMYVPYTLWLCFALILNLYSLPKIKVCQDLFW